MSKWIALLCLLPSVAHAHAGDAAPWTLNPWVIGSVVVASALYLRGAWAIGSGHRGLENGAFALAMITLLIALVSPLDTWSDYSFAAHMTQHELLMLLAAPLLVVARPLPVYLRALRMQPRWLASRRALTFFRALSAPTVTLLVHGAIRWLWHMPAWFEAALASEWVHGVQHASFFLSALLFWWGLVQGRYGRAGYGLAFLYVLMTAMHTGALGALLAFSEHAWYPSYAERGGVRDVVLDQQIAGQIMWVGAGVWMMFLALALLLAWLGEARRRVLRGSVTLVLLLCACGHDETRLVEDLTGGDVTRGERAFREYGCGSCHELHGDFTAQGSVGPSFHDFAYQSYLPGGLPNTPINLMRWIQHPREVEPRTAMPDLGVSDNDARDLAAFLYTMR